MSERGVKVATKSWRVLGKNGDLIVGPNQAKANAYKKTTTAIRPSTVLIPWSFPQLPQRLRYQRVRPATADDLRALIYILEANVRARPDHKESSLKIGFEHVPLRNETHRASKERAKEYRWAMQWLIR
jgi:hypothetical protein